MSGCVAPLPVAVLISGGGTTLKNLIERRRAGELPVSFQLVISSNPAAKGVAFAEAEQIPVKVAARQNFSSAEVHRDTVFAAIRESGAKLVIMGGYLEHLLIADDFKNRVVNIHPSLIPAFSGKGYYGLRVHQAALDFGAKISGCTVHFVDNEYDHGPIIAQRSCPINPDDTTESLAARVFALECDLLPEVVTAIAMNRVQVQNRQVRIHEAVR